MIYSETAMSDSTFDPAILQVGDTFSYNGIAYTVERAFVGGPFMTYTEGPTVVNVVSYGHEEGGPFYQVATWDGDWQGCHPEANSIEDALFAEIARGCEISNHEFK